MTGLPVLLHFEPVEWAYGDQTHRITILRQRSGRLVHRNCPDRPALPGAGPSPRCRCQRYLRARRTYRMAHASPGTNFDRHRRLRMGSAARRSHRGDSPRRCRLVLTRRKALARSDTDHSHGSHCHSRTVRRQSRRLDGARLRRPISTMKFKRTDPEFEQEY
jgi:hypothetical protein